MFKKNNKKEEKTIYEVRLGKFITEPNTSPEPDMFLELDPNNFKTEVCYVFGNIAVNQNDDAFYVLERDNDKKIKASELSKIHANTYYVLDVNKTKTFSRKETKEFFKNLKKAIVAKEKAKEKNYDELEKQGEDNHKNIR